MEERAPTKQETIDKLLEVKQRSDGEIYLAPIIQDLEWYRNLRKNSDNGSGGETDGLWYVMEKVYSEFSVTELDELISKLK